MTAHLYYTDSFLYEFDAELVDIIPSSEAEPRPSVVLDRTAFYPTSGGQVFDTGWLQLSETPSNKSSVLEVLEKEDGTVLHVLEDANPFSKGNSGSRCYRCRTPSRSHAAAFRSAPSLRGLRTPVRYAYHLVPHGR
jgi:Ser-tRNA(Ala) deacylase AlaX